jgi:hypothetical protein
MPATDLLRSRICKQEVTGSIPVGSTHELRSNSPTVACREEATQSDTGAGFHA